jgi:hypothetical protein
MVRGFKPPVVTGNPAQPWKDEDIAAVSEACVKCAREIPGCTGCAFGAAIQEEAAAAAKPKSEPETKAAARDAKELK